MAEQKGLEQIVQKVVSQVLENHIPQLRQDLVRCVLQELPSLEAGQAGASTENRAIANILKAVSAIHASLTQREVLRALLDNTVRYTGRAALFVVKASTATGWQSRGFTTADDDAVKDFALDTSSGLTARVMQSRMAMTGSTAEMDQKFVKHFGAPADKQVLIFPLLLKEKVAALVYADGGAAADGRMDTAALEVLVMAASAWLEVASLRKQAHKEGAPEIPERSDSTPVAQKTSAGSDPFASHAPNHLAAAVSASAEVPMAVAQAGPAGGAAAAAPALDALSHLSSEDADVHRKAQRFARLLVDEIKLYNQTKVSEGRKNKDLYDRLREDIEKSRATYQKRYGSTAAAEGDYFNHELVRSLAEDDTSIMGADFRR